MPPKRSIGKGRPLKNYKDRLDSVSFTRYIQKIKACGGMDPFTLESSVMSSLAKDLPWLKKSHILDYYTKSKCHRDESNLNVQRGVQSYELFVAGYVTLVESLNQVHANVFILRGKVS
jgi:hypothetical protein